MTAAEKPKKHQPVQAPERFQHDQFRPWKRKAPNQRGFQDWTGSCSTNKNAPSKLKPQTLPDLLQSDKWEEKKWCEIRSYCLTSNLTSAFNLSWSYIHFIRGSRVKSQDNEFKQLNIEFDWSFQTKTKSSLPVDTQDLTNISSRVTLLKPVTEPSSKEASLWSAVWKTKNRFDCFDGPNLQTYWPCCRRQKT